jgi:FMN phosphatase YigB (HAD superfamily)
MAPSWLICDVDDTLVGTFATAVHKYGLIARRFGLAEPNSADLIAAGYGSRPFDDCASQLIPGVSLAEIRRCYDELAGEVQPVPLGDLGHLLSAAAGLGWRVGIFTNGPGRKTRSKLAALRLAEGDVDFVLTGDDLEVRKPSPASFDWLCRRVGIDRRLGWYVSDAPGDWLGCEVAGLNSVGVIGPLQVHAHRWAAPRLSVVSFPDLAPLLASLPRLPRDAGALPPVRAVTFDVGGTLLRERESVAVCLAAVLPGPQPAGISARLEHALASVLRGGLPAGTWSSAEASSRRLTQAYDRALGYCGVRTPGSSAVAGLARYCAAANWELISAGRVAAIRAIRCTGMRLGLISNWPAGLGEILASAGMEDCFDQVASSCREGAEKPAPAMFARAAERLGVRMDEVLHVGDDPRADVGGALAARCRAAFVTGVRTDDEFSGLLRLGSACTPNRDSPNREDSCDGQAFPS